MDKPLPIGNIGFLQAGKWHCQPLEHDKYCGLMILPPAGMGLDSDEALRLVGSVKTLPLVFK